MKKSILLVAFITLLLSSSSQAQAYYEIYPTASALVQNKMNTNKISGIEILTGISAHHIIGLTGISVSAKNQLENLLNENVKVTSFEISDDLTSLQIDAEASLTNVEIQAILNEVNGVITGHAIEYTTEQ